MLSPLLPALVNVGSEEIVLTGSMFEAGYTVEREGRGAMRYGNGDYAGELQEGRPEGRGVWGSFGGTVYEGEWKAGVREGRGVYRHADGNVYDGEWKTDKREGRGVERYADGTVYEGEWKADEREGRGVMRFASGDVYEGEYEADMPQGRGAMQYVNGDTYDGEWKAGKRDGRGVYRYADGSADTAFYKQEAKVGEGLYLTATTATRLRDGKGVALISLEEARRTVKRLGLPLPSPFPTTDGTVYEGDRYELNHEHAAEVSNTKKCKGGAMQGEYEGEYNAAGEREGRGVMRFADGDIYEGEWKAGWFEGHGVYRHANGGVDAVFFKQSAPVGEAVRWMADGQRAARLRDGNLVEMISLEEARRTAERLGWLGLPTSPLEEAHLF